MTERRMDSASFSQQELSLIGASHVWRNYRLPLSHAEVKPLTRELAEEFRDLEASPTERALDESRVRHLREKAEAGQLVTFNWSTAKLSGRKLRMNGMHSSTMLCGLNGNFPENLRVHLDTYEVDLPEALAILFRQIRRSQIRADTGRCLRRISGTLHRPAGRAEGVGETRGRRGGVLTQ